MYRVDTFNWDVEELSETDRAAVRALNELSPSLPSAGYATNDPSAFLDAFRTLLHSADVRARGVALDQYHYAGANHRWTGSDPLDTMDAEVAVVARDLLAVPHQAGVPLLDQPHVVSCWNSALSALARSYDGSDGDLPRIVTVLDTMMRSGSTLDSTGIWALEVRLPTPTRPPAPGSATGWPASLPTSSWPLTFDKWS